MTPAEILKREIARQKREGLELALLQQLRALGLTDGMVRQHAFHPARKWRFDFSWPAQRLAMEVDGGTWTNGAHSRGSGVEKDCEKLAHAVINGWRVMRCTTDQVKGGIAAAWIEAALADRPSVDMSRISGTLAPSRQG